MSATDTAAPTLACTACNTVNAAVARFCSGCGTTLSAAAPGSPPGGGFPNAVPVGVPVPPKPPLVPPLNGAISGLMNSALGGGGGEGVVKAAFPMDASTAFMAVTHAVTSNGGQVKFVQPPTSMTFETTKRAIGLTIRYDGLVQVATMNAQQSAIRVQLQPVKGTLTPVFFVGAIASLFMMFTWYITLGLGLLGLLFGIVATAAQYHSLATATPRTMAEKILAAMSSGTPAISAPDAPKAAGSWIGKLTQPPAFVSNLMNGASPSTPASPTAERLVATPSATESSVFEQLTQLGKLRDSGILTLEEFDQKKAELLSRL